MIESKLLEYYEGDEYPAKVWRDKYSVKNLAGEVQENTPDDMHVRLATEVFNMEKQVCLRRKNYDKKNLSILGRKLEDDFDFEKILKLFKNFSNIIPQGSIMSMLGNIYKVGSLSNCFVIPPPEDSYGGIMKTDERLVQLMKRRGGVGLHISTLRPTNSIVTNAAGSSTGAVSFMHRFSNTTREVAQNDRRGALMLLIHCLHPEIFDFVKIKSDLTKVTGANVSTMLTDIFMKAVEADTDFICKFPVDVELSENTNFDNYEYNKIVEYKEEEIKCQIMKIRALELFNLIVDMAHANGEPGIAFIDRVHNYSPDGVYELFRAIACNPCGEQWLPAFDACRLLALNLFSAVRHPYTENAYIDYDDLYYISYVQQKIADLIVDLEIKAIDKIIDKINNDPESFETKMTELELWQNVKKIAKSSRRTGSGFTALADVFAAVGVRYGSDESLKIAEKIAKTKMKAELDCSIDLAVMYGAFEGFDENLEFEISKKTIKGKNDFYNMMVEEFPEQVKRMIEHGRRNVSWSTVAPTGTVSIIAKLLKYSNTTAGVEPMFFPWYFRNRKVNPGNKDVRVDFIDQSGDAWTTYPVLMGGFKEWYDVNPLIQNEDGSTKKLEDMVEKELLYCFEHSPYYNSCANDLNWEERIEMQRVIQRYTTNAISSTINLPNNVSKEVVAGIYMKAWKMGLKGVTVCAALISNY